MLCMHAARKSFVECEASEKLRRALRSKTRPVTSKDYHTGAKVLYKREKDVKWHGPAKVLGVDNKCVNIKHQGQIYRVSPCHLQLYKCEEVPTTPNHSASISPDSTPQQSSTEKIPDKPVVSVHDGSDDEECISTIDGLNNVNEQVDNFETEGSPSTPVAFETDGAPMTNPTIEVGEIPKKDSKIVYKLHDNDVLRNAIVVGRGGTARGVNKFYFNIQNEDKSLSGLDLGKVEGWKYVEGIFLLGNAETNDILAAKVKELDNLRSHDAVVEVEDQGQDAINSRWIVTEKLKEGVRVVKARLVAKGFQEKCNNELRKDSPTILKINLRMIACISSYVVLSSRENLLIVMSIFCLHLKRV